MIHLSCLLLLLQFRYLFICFLHFHSLFHLFSCSSRSRCSTVNVVLTFNDSLILFAPSSPIALPVHLFLSFSFPSLFLFYSYSSLPRSSSVNVVLTFNDSLILIAPSAPILLPVHLFISFSFHSLLPFLFLFITTQPQFSQCSINLQWFTYLACSWISNFVTCSFVLFIFISLSFFHFHSCSSPPRSSLVNVVLTFNDSLILLAPESPIMLTVH